MPDSRMASSRELPGERPASEGIPAWISPALFASDGVMLAVAALWTFAGNGDWRWLGIGCLLAVGSVQALVAWSLRPRQETAPSSTQRWPEPGEPAGSVPRMRVHFVDELPRKRR